MILAKFRYSFNQITRSYNRASAIMSGTPNGEPPSKKAKTGWENYTLNCSEALIKVDEGKHFADLLDIDVSALQGIGPRSSDVLESLRIKTVKELAEYKYFHMARCIATLAETETKNGRVEGSVMNLDKGVTKEWESSHFRKSLKHLLKLLKEYQKMLPICFVIWASRRLDIWLLLNIVAGQKQLL